MIPPSSFLSSPVLRHTNMNKYSENSVLHTLNKLEKKKLSVGFVFLFCFWSGFLLFFVLFCHIAFGLKRLSAIAISLLICTTDFHTERTLSKSAVIIFRPRRERR